MAIRKGAVPSSLWVYKCMAEGQDLTDYQKRLLKRTAELMVVHQGIAEKVEEEGVGDMQGLSALIPAMVQLTREIRANLDRVFPVGSGGEGKADEWLARLREGKDR